MLSIALLSINDAQATHLRAADIYSTRIDRLTFDFTLSIYHDPGGVDLFPLEDAIVISDGTTYSVNGLFDSSPHIQGITQAPVSSEVTKTEIVFRHTFSNAGRPYTVKYSDVNRVAGVKNINNSVLVPFEIEYTFFLFANDLQLNTSPILTYSPIDDAAVGQTFFHNPGAYDPDGDSISFSLSRPRGSNGNLLNKVFSFDGLGSLTEAYMDPNFVGIGPALGTTFTLDPVRGDLVWDYPVEEGEYNVAFVVEEWRNGIRISQTVRDMQIFVESTNNERPILYVPEDTCIAASTNLTALIGAKDPDGYSISLNHYGQVFRIPNPATFIKDNTLPVDTAGGTFSWTPNCDQIKNQPYQAQFRVEDFFPDQINLTTIRTWLINVYGPAPTNLTSSLNGDDIALTWDAYPCTNASKIGIYRIECDTSLVNRSACETGVPASWGFTKIGTVDANQTFFLDNNGGKPFKSGIQYHYVVAAEFISPEQSESYASNITTIELGFNIPIISRASVVTTDSINGEIELDIVMPTGLNALTTPPPYTFEIFRNLGQVDADLTGTPIHTFTQNTLTDISYTDIGINTSDSAYTYSIKFYSNGNLEGEYTQTSSTFLTTRGKVGAIDLSWKKQAPWFYTDTLYHVIWADTNGLGFVKLDSVPGTQTNYTMDGLSPYDTVCFWVETKGVFCSQVLDGISINNTQESCDFVRDNIPPCQPTTTLDIKNCTLFDDQTVLQNTLNWEFNSCNDTDLAGFNIYFSPVNLENYILLARINNPEQRSFTHDNLTTLTYCYLVKAYDFSGNESTNTLSVCGDNCEYFELPNVFTPNKDNINETFIPYPTPRAVQNIAFQVYNRWGKLIFTADNVSQLEWDGTSNDGSVLSSGTYYYIAVVTFDKLNPEDRVKEYKGWIQLMRE